MIIAEAPRQYLCSGRLARRYRATTTSYARKFTAADVVLLAELDSLHGTLSGPATRVLLERACHLFGEARYARLATISVAHLYHLRAKPLYQQRRVHHSKTQTRPSTIGTRRAPAPEGRPGFIRIDTVHQGDLDGRKGLKARIGLSCYRTRNARHWFFDQLIGVRKMRILTLEEMKRVAGGGGSCSGGSSSNCNLVTTTPPTTEPGTTSAGG